MKITRQTMRADGLTVGESMDRDAAFLRSVGFDVKDGQPTHDEKEDAYIEKVREAVLSALDSVDGVDPIKAFNLKGGWRDQDLCDLFPAIDAQAKRQFSRLKP